MDVTNYNDENVCALLQHRFTFPICFFQLIFKMDYCSIGSFVCFIILWRFTVKAFLDQKWVVPIEDPVLMWQFQMDPRNVGDCRTKVESREEKVKKSNKFFLWNNPQISKIQQMRILMGGRHKRNPKQNCALEINFKIRLNYWIN